MSSGRTTGARGWLSPRQVVDFADAVRAQLRLDATLTVPELMRRTGATEELARLVKKRWAEGATQP